jgi:hypothetical protein
MKTGVTIIDGIRELKAALDAGVVMKEAFVCPVLYQSQGQGDVEQEILKSFAAQNIAVFEVTKDIFCQNLFWRS